MKGFGVTTVSFLLVNLLVVSAYPQGGYGGSPAAPVPAASAPVAPGSPATPAASIASSAPGAPVAPAPESAAQSSPVGLSPVAVATAAYPSAPAASAAVTAPASGPASSASQASPASSSPTGSASARSPPTGSAPTGSAPAGSAPAGSAPAGSAPTGSAPAGSAPASSAPASSAPAAPAASPTTQLSFAPSDGSSISTSVGVPSAPSSGKTSSGNCQQQALGGGRFKVVCSGPEKEALRSEHVLWLKNSGGSDQVVDIEIPNYKIEELIKAGFKPGPVRDSIINVLLKKPTTSVDAQVEEQTPSGSQPKVNLQYETGEKKLVHFPNDHPYSPLVGPLLPPLAAGAQATRVVKRKRAPVPISP